MVVAGRFSDGACWLLSRDRSGGLARGGTGLGVLGVKSVGALAYASRFEVEDRRELGFVADGLSKGRILLLVVVPVVPVVLTGGVCGDRSRGMDFTGWGALTLAKDV